MCIECTYVECVRDDCVFVKCVGAVLFFFRFIYYGFVRVVF